MPLDVTGINVTVGRGGVKGDPGPSDFTPLLNAMQAAHVLTGAQVAAVLAILSGAPPIVLPIGGDGTLDGSNPDDSGLFGH